MTSQALISSGLVVAAAPPTKSPSPPASTCRRLSYDSAQTRSQTRASSRSLSTPQQPGHVVAAAGERAGPPLPAYVTPGTAVAPRCSGSPAAKLPSAGGRARRLVGVSLDVVAYRSSPPSPSPTAAAAVVAVPATLQQEQQQQQRVSGALSSASPFSCVLTTQTRSSVFTEQASSATTSGEKPMALCAYTTPPVTLPPCTMQPPQPRPAEKTVVHTQPAKPVAVAVSALYTAACTPDPKQQQQLPEKPSPLRGVPSVAATPPHPAVPAPQLRRTRSASNGARGAPHGVRPVPSLRSGITGPSPFAADLLAMPRRASPVKAQPIQLPPTQSQQHQQVLRPPQVQLARPGGLYRHKGTTTTITNANTTSMAASQLPGAATAHTRLQLPQRSRLIRTASSTANATEAVGAAARRRAPSASSITHGQTLGTAAGGGGVATSPFKRRFSATSTAATSTVAVYTTRGGDSSRPLSRGGPLRSSSAPALRHAAAAIPAATTTAVPATLRPSSNASRRLHTATAIGTESASGGSASSHPISSPLKHRSSTAAASGTRERALRQRSASATRVVSAAASTTATATAAGAVGGGTLPVGSRGPSFTVSREAGGGGVGSRLGNCTARVASSTTLPRRPALTSGGSGARPMISAVSGGAQGGRPAGVAAAQIGAAVTSSTRPSATIARRVRSDRSGATTGHHTSRAAVAEGNVVAASKASMITMAESREFLKEFQHMTQRELTLFGTLLTTVAGEKRQQQKSTADPSRSPRTTAKTNGAVGVASSTTKTDAAAAAAAAEIDVGIVLQSAAEVSVWARREGDPAVVEGLSGSADDGGAAAATVIAPLAIADAHMKEDDEVVVLVRRSCSRVTPSPTRRLHLDSQDRPRSSSPRPSAPTVPHAMETAALGQQWRDTHARKGSERDASPMCHVDPSASSPSPASPLVGPTDGAAPATANRTTQRAIEGKVGVLQPRCVNENVAKACRRTAGGATTAPNRKLQSNADAASARQRPSSSLHSLHSSRSRRRRRVAPGEKQVELLSCLTNDAQTRQRSVTTYTDVRSYSRRSDNHSGLSDGVQRDALDHVVRGYSSSEEAGAAGVEVVSKDAPPLAALRRVKELAAEKTAALVQRQRERQQQKEMAEGNGEASVSAASPSMFSSCGSPAGSSSVGRPSGAAAEVAEVRLSAAQLQLLIDGSRSRQNWERYQQL